MEYINPNHNKEIKQKTIKAVNEGRAVPTPGFAVEEGGEMLTALEKELSTMNPEELGQFSRVLNEVMQSTTIETFKKTLIKDTPFFQKYSLVLPTTFAFFLGSYLTEGNPAMGMTAAGGVGILLSSMKVNGMSQADKDKLTQKIERIKSLIEKTQEKQRNSGN